MPHRDHAPIGAPCWVDLMTSDTERARAFYTEVFGWEAEDPAPEFGGYFNFRRNGVRVAGCMGQMPDSPMPDVWTVHLATDDAAKTLEAAAANGGEVRLQPMAVGDLGTMAAIGDCGGANVGVWQPGTHLGFGLLAEAGTPSWFELHTRDYAASVEFYRNVFRWQTSVASDTDDLRYTVMVDGDDQLAGIMDGALPEGAPAQWTVYFGVDDADATLARIVELGGTVVQAAEDTPYGRLAVATDPTGAPFRLMGPNVAEPGRAAES